jgi:hypothetical protein
MDKFKKMLADVKEYNNEQVELSVKKDSQTSVLDFLTEKEV